VFHRLHRATGHKSMPHVATLVALGGALQPWPRIAPHAPAENRRPTPMPPRRPLRVSLDHLVGDLRPGTSVARRCRARVAPPAMTTLLLPPSHISIGHRL
jgi:hypothetical protein